MALAVLAIAPAAAQATVTKSQITSPGDPYYRLDNGDLPDDEREVKVTGTTDGTEGDLVDLRCYYGHYYGGRDSYGLADGVALGAGGALDYTGPVWPLSANHQACRLAAVPAGADPDDLAPFQGPRVAVTYVESSTTNVNDGTQAREDFWLDAPGFKGTAGYYSAGSDGIYNYYAVTNRRAFGRADYASWDSAADLYSGWNGSTTQVDGNQAYNNYTAPTVDPDAGGPLPYGKPVGFEALQSDVQVSQTTGDVKIVESTPLYICPNGAYPGDASNCQELEKTGVRLDRTTLQQQDGLVIRVTDTLVSTDGKGHRVKLQYSNSAGMSDGPVWQMPGESDFSGASNYESVGRPATPGSLMARDWYYGYSMDSQIAAGMTWLTQPDRLLFASYDRPLSQFTLDVPANGAVPVQQVYTAPRSVEEGRQLATAIEDSAGSPVVEVTAPANGTAVDHADVVVQGNARDNKGVKTLKVNGIATTLTGDGTWSVPLHLASGANTITAVATDAQGNVGQAQVTVSYVPPKSAPLCKVPSVKRGAKLGPVKAAIKNAECRVGKVSKARSRKVRKGRVISVAPRAGYVLVGNSRVDVLVSSGKPKKAKKTKAGKRR